MFRNLKMIEDKVPVKKIWLYVTVDKITLDTVTEDTMPVHPIDFGQNDCRNDDL